MSISWITPYSYFICIKRINFCDSGDQEETRKGSLSMSVVIGTTSVKTRHPDTTGGHLSQTPVTVTPHTYDGAQET